MTARSSGSSPSASTPLGRAANRGSLDGELAGAGSRRGQAPLEPRYGGRTSLPWEGCLCQTDCPVLVYARWRWAHSARRPPRPPGDVRLADPFDDPGVGEFGLINAVFPVGDTFVEVVSAVQPGTTAGRYLARRDPTAATRPFPDAFARTGPPAGDRSGNTCGVEGRPSTTSSARTCTPKASRGRSCSSTGRRRRTRGDGETAWTGTAPDHRAGGIAGITIEVEEPAVAASGGPGFWVSTRRWTVG